MPLCFEYATSAEGVAFILRWLRDQGKVATAILLSNQAYNQFRTDPLVQQESYVPVIRRGCMAYINNTSLFIIRPTRHSSDDLLFYDAPITETHTSIEIYDNFDPIAKVSPYRGLCYPSTT